MAVRVVCHKCGKRLKLPEGFDHKRTAKCPKCLSVVDLTAAIEASVYISTATVRAKPPNQPEAPTHTQAQAPTVRSPKPPPLPPSKPQAQPRPPEVPLSLDDDNAHAKANNANNANTTPLSLDDDPAPADSPPAEVPFRVPVRVLADSARQALGSCFAVFVSHGIFLEQEALRPFLYAPVGCVAESPTEGELILTLPDGRVVALQIESRAARAISRDALAFLAGERGALVAADYRRKWWLLWPAIIFACALAWGPILLAQTANYGRDWGLKVGAIVACVGLLVNAGVVLFSRRSVPAQIAVMAALCVAVTGACYFGASAFLAGKNQPPDQAQNANNGDNPQPPDVPLTPPLPVPPENGGIRKPPSHIDRAYAQSVSALEDGPSDVTALSLATDWNTLGIGYADGNTRFWLLDQPTFETFQVGPKADSSVTRVQFDTSGRYVILSVTSGAFVAARGSSAPPAKIPGTFVAVAPELADDRVRFAAIRTNTVAQRLLPTAFVLNPPKKAKGFALTTTRDEITPAGVAVDPGKPTGPTFLAWTPNLRLLAGAPDGAITVWSPAMKLETVNRDHKTAVKAWAECATTGNFATGDEKGNVAVWPYKSTKPSLASVFTTPITALSFSPSGASLAVADNSGWLAVWDIASAKVVSRVKRPTAIKAFTFGPTDDTLLLANGKTVELWTLSELLK
jgi:phage FluMu protein Com